MQLGLDSSIVGCLGVGFDRNFDSTQRVVFAKEAAHNPRGAFGRTLNPYERQVTGQDGVRACEMDKAG